MTAVFPSAWEIARRLAERAEALCKTLLPRGRRRREGAEWRCGSIAGEAGGSLAVRLTGERCGLWQDRATGDGGDALDLVRATLDCTMPEAIAWARHWLGVKDGKAPKPHRSASPKHHDEPAADTRPRALEIWREAVEDIAGTPAEVYLQSRGLDPVKLYSLHGLGRWPATLRYSERAALDPNRHCRALVIAVHGADCGLVRAVHRVLLHSDGSAVRDERGRKRKLSLGPIAGNAAMGDYWPDPGGRWGLGEGLETALAAFALTGIPTWAAISAGNMPRIAPPSWARQVTIFADRDPPGMEAAAEALRRLRGYAGIESVRVVGALAEGGDAADVLIGESWRAR